jgi:hypothetical protein
MQAKAAPTIVALSRQLQIGCRPRSAAPKPFQEQRSMAKKKPKKPAPKPAAKRSPAPAARPAPVADTVVLYELRGLAGVRYHGEYSDIERARLAARHLVSSPDVEQAWVLKNVEIVKLNG